jgi:hypothetical protein
MPWVATEAWVGEILSDGTIGNARRVAGGSDESVFQPEWSPDGYLYFITDQRGGWWNLYRERNGVIEAMAPVDAEFGRPQWQFGMSTYAFESGERLICCFVQDGIWKLAQIDMRTKRFDVIPTEWHLPASRRSRPGGVFGRDAVRGGRARRPESRHRHSPDYSTLIGLARRGQALCLNA